MLILLDLTSSERETIRERLVAWLAQRNLGYGDFASMAGVSRSAIKHLCSGSRLNDGLIRCVLRVVPDLAAGLPGVLIVPPPSRN